MNHPVFLEMENKNSLKPKIETVNFTQSPSSISWWNISGVPSTAWGSLFVPRTPNWCRRGFPISRIPPFAQMSWHLHLWPRVWNLQPLPLAGPSKKVPLSWPLAQLVRIREWSSCTWLDSQTFGPQVPQNATKVRGFELNQDSCSKFGNTLFVLFPLVWTTFFSVFLEIAFEEQETIHHWKKHMQTGL